MQDLIVGDEYIATLHNDFYRGESVHVKYLGFSDEYEDCIIIEVVTATKWPTLEDDEGIWEKGYITPLYTTNYTFEPFNPNLENE